MKPVITVLGCCRQYSVARHYETTGILEGLVYPHYSKEIRQAVEYLGQNHIDPSLTRWCFRTGLLTGRAVDYESLARDFRRTDLFVVEIASRKSYEWRNLYMHEIAVDPKYGFPERGQVAVQEQSDAEIEEDLCRIKELLAPRPMLLVGHLTTYQHGSRYGLVQLLRRLAEKYAIPFFDPAVLLEEYTAEQLYAKEPTLAHYTDFGHEVVGRKYKELIDKIM